MKSFTHTANKWFCAYDLVTKKVLVSARTCTEGAKTNYDDTKVEVLIAESKTDLDALIDGLSLVR